MPHWMHLPALVLCLGSVLAVPEASAKPAQKAAPPPAAPAFTGSASCRDCHEKFYKLWSTSFHGLAMRPYDDALAASLLGPQEADIVIGQAAYRMRLGAGEGFLEERTDGQTKTYPIAQVLGGKNVFYFLTPLERGRLQTLPLAYDVRRKQWYDMAGSAARHFPGGPSPTLSWKDWPYTFNTGCYGCHVSQLSTNYDPRTDTYATTWTEPGINCETCHGPGQEHIRVCQAAPKNNPPKDMKLIRGGSAFTHAQQNDLCGACHAKTVPLTVSFAPGERYFDHFDLIGYENPDFHPDGRDLGENYTMTSWARSPCALSGQLDCMHCHTSSGRYKFADPAKANDACKPCHADRVDNASSHTRHPEGSPGNRCVSCHMPATEFARMRRSDHSMLPPTPAATLAYGSPNACTLCHADKDAAWADGQVRAWHANDYQAPVLARAELVAAARRGDWSGLAAMLDCVADGKSDAVYAASLLRLLRPCADGRKWPAIVAAASAPSPLVRAAAAEALTDGPTPEGLAALVRLCADDYRLVRVRAAAALSGVPRQALDATSLPAVERATAEFLASLAARPDLWTSQYNLGNHALGQGDAQRAVGYYEKARLLDPAAVAPLVNLSIALGRLGQPEAAEQALAEALRLAPDDAPAHFNLGLLLAATNPEDALRFARQAGGLRPDNPRYAYALAFLLARSGQSGEALAVLRPVVASRPDYAEAARLYGRLLRQAGQKP
ncbi:MAG: tetratricopeptide repeat protein [Solidesulfovibrio sp.]|uniref:tetratricopeptide repeat protein n=1 Tax=Solidesulfovibrio sp. TaxID=2910990 RepID=UPI00315992F5